MRKLKVLITGGTGFVGRNLIDEIKKKYDLFVLSRKEYDIAEVKYFKGELKKYDSIKDLFKDIDIVIHLAFSKNYPENITIASKLIKACKKNNIKKIILLSSMSAKRSCPDEYGKTKLKIENIVKKSRLNYTILRPSIIYGKGSTGFDFIINYINKIPIFTPIIGSGRYFISPVHIKDVIKSVEKCINNKKTDKKEYDLPGGEEIYFIELINALKKNKCIKKINVYVPLWFCYIVSNILPKIISKENIKNLTESSLANIKSAKEDIQYNPIKFSRGIKDGLI